MSTPAQIDANRRNAQRSTGPKTPEGKAASRQNAITHGLTADRHALIEGESEADYQVFAEAMIEALAPADAYEDALARRIVLLSWRLDRVARIEATRFSKSPDLLADLSGLSRYEATLSRDYDRTVKMLERRQDGRRRALAETAKRSQPAARPGAAKGSQFPAAIRPELPPAPLLNSPPAADGAPAYACASP